MYDDNRYQSDYNTATKEDLGDMERNILNKLDQKFEEVKNFFCNLFNVSTTGETHINNLKRIAENVSMDIDDANKFFQEYVQRFVQDRGIIAVDSKNDCVVVILGTEGYYPEFNVLVKRIDRKTPYNMLIHDVKFNGSYLK